MKVVAAALAGMMLLVACTGTGVTSSTPPDSAAPTSGGSASHSSAATTSPAATGTAPPGSAIVPAYSGPRPMPAAGPGPMLWPTTSDFTQWGRLDDAVTRHGFVDVNGKLVVPERYEGYAYCRDASGKVSFLVATATGRHADVIDLSGTVIGHAPTQDATCGPPGMIVFTRVVDSELGKVYDGLMAVPSGRIVLPLVTGRSVAVVNDDTVNVSEAKGEYFLNPRTGTRTPHPGYVTEAELADGAPGLPASTVRPNVGDGRFGYLGLTGTWLLKPSFDDAAAFSEGYAVVRRGDDRYTFVDKTLRRVGQDWSDIETVWVTSAGGADRPGGYLVSGAAGQGLLASDLRPIVAPGKATITCNYQANGACSATVGGKASLATLPDGTVTSMPDGFTQAIGPSFLADTVRTEDNDEAASRVLALGGNAITLDGASACAAVGTAWAACQPISPVLPPLVIDAQGRRTAFATIEQVPDPSGPSGPAYYWAVAGKYQGFIDASGQWLYRESRYSRVEE